MIINDKLYQICDIMIDVGDQHEKMNRGWIPSVVEKMKQEMSKVGCFHIRQIEEDCSKFRCISSGKLNKNGSWEAETVDFYVHIIAARGTLTLHLFLVILQDQAWFYLD